MSYCWLLAVSKPVWHITVAVCTVLDSWWWTENLSETCRILFQKKIFEISASRWFYYKNMPKLVVSSKKPEGSLPCSWRHAAHPGDKTRRSTSQPPTTLTSHLRRGLISRLCPSFSTSKILYGFPVAPFCDKFSLPIFVFFILSP